MSVLKVEKLTKIFTSGLWPFQTPKRHLIVNEISFELQKGEILGFLGPNGAGKTTTIQMLLGTLTPTSGKISYFQNDFTKNKIVSLQKIGYASGYERLPSRLTVIDNLDIIGRLYGINQTKRKQQIESLLKFFGIWDLRNRQTGSLSAGQTTRVMLTKAFICEPQIVLLDEPTASLDPDVAHDVRQFIKSQRAENQVSVLITSHNMDEVTELCDRVIILKNGSIFANDTPLKLAQSISKVFVHLNINSKPEQVLAYLQHTKLNHKMISNNLTVEIDEHSISQFLIELSENKISYSHISIDKPTLEDYFLNIAKSKKEGAI